jgi:peptidoglycan hydrolase-like protein with peptidoglycan-binding domain
MIVTAFVGVSSASAQAMSLSDLVNLFISLGIISPDKAAAAKAAVSTSASSASVTFTRDLTIGSSGADVSALQAKLGVSPASGYFGSLTKAAVVVFQTANGVPGTGYVGALTRAKLNAGSTMTTTTTTTTSSSSSVVNTGVEGTVTVSKSSISNTTAYEGDTMKPIIAIKVEAKVSNINVQRVKLNLGTSSSIYTKVYKTIYVTDASGAVIAQADLNSNTVVKDGSNYYLTLGGFSYNVEKDASKILTVKADLYSSLKTADLIAHVITVDANGVRGVDGAGIDQYGPASSFSQSVTAATSLVDSAALAVSTNSANFKSADVIASNGTLSDELDGVALLAFDLAATKDAVTVTDITAAISDTTNNSTTTTAYLYEGSTLVASESVNGAAVTFSDIDNLVIAKDATKTLTIKVDVRSANGTSNTLSITGVTVTAENSQGSSVTPSGSAVGESMFVRNVGPIFTLVGTPTMTRQAISSVDASGAATSTGFANFTVGITAKGGDISFGSMASSTNLFGDITLSTTTNTLIGAYKNSVVLGTTGLTAANGGNGVKPILSYAVPSSGVTISGETFTLTKNNSVNIPVTAQFTVSGTSANSYAVQINGFAWQNDGAKTSTFMTNKSEWRTPAVSLP